MYKQKKNQVHHLILLALCQIVLMKNLMKKESNKNWTTCLRLNSEDGSPRVFLLNSHFLGSVPIDYIPFFLLSPLKWRQNCESISTEIVAFFKVDLYIGCVSIKDEGPLGYSKDNRDKQAM